MLKVLIAGAGMGGLTAARALARAGFSVQVVEQAEELREVGAGLALHPRPLTILRSLGVRLKETVEVRWGMLGTPQGWRLKTPLLFRSQFLHRAHLQAMLAEDVPISLGFSCQEAGQDEQGVYLRSADGRELRADLLIGADGVHSAVRRSLLGPSPPRDCGYPSWRAVIRWPEWPAHTACEVWGWKTRWGAMGMTDGRVCWWATSLSGNLSALQRWPWQLPQRMLSSTLPEQIYFTPIVDLPHLPRWGQGRITLLGDAAHATSPNLGAGAGMAIEDAHVLAESLARQPGVEGLRAYERARRGPCRRIVQMSHALGWLSHRNPLGLPCS